jgi:hypothetical protein
MKMDDVNYKKRSREIVGDAEAIEKLLKEIHELKRTRSEAEAAAEVRGHKAGGDEARRQIRAAMT